MSPAHAHVEQSRNTLAFATRAKEVTNSARVNLVVSDKDLVKQLQKEVARLEAELRVPEPVLPSEALLQEKELQIQKMESEMRELIRQRDAAKAQLDEVLHKIGDEQREQLLQDQGTPTKSLLGEELGCQSKSAPMMLIQEIRKLEKLQDELGEDASRALEALQKEVECLRLAQVGMNQDAASTITKLQAELRNLHAQRAAKEENADDMICTNSMNSSLKDEISRLQALGNSDRTDADAAIATLEEQLESVQMSLDKMVLGSPGVNRANTDVSSPTKLRTPTRKKKLVPTTMGGSSRQLFAGSPPCSPRARSTCLENNENTPPRSSENTPSAAHRRNNSVDIRKMQNLFKTAAEENIKSIRAYVTELKERVAKLQYQKQLLVCQVLELESNTAYGGGDPDIGGVTPPVRSPSTWHLPLEKQRMQIIELWDVCQVSIIHRTQFYLLFRGDPADAMYMEVEFRRLLWLQEQFSKTDHHQSPCVTDEENLSSFAASCRALRRERELLAKRMRRLTPELRDELLIKWGIPLDSKQRKLQLAEKVWTDPHDMQHIQDSADVVAQIVGFWEPGSASKEMFALNFAPPSNQKPFHFGWNSISTILNF